jgi:hypothetical protein
VYFAQVIISYIIILVGLVNLTLRSAPNDDPWSTLISGVIGYLLPNPSLQNRRENNAVLRKSTRQHELEDLSEQHDSPV